MLTFKISDFPAVEPVTVSDVKLHTRIDTSVEDTLIGNWITSARQQAEEFQRRSYITQEITLSFDGFPSLPILLPRSPVQEVTEFLYYDATGTEYDFDLGYLELDYDSEPARINLGYGISFPSLQLRTLNAIKIVYTAGYGDAGSDVPQIVHDAILLYCSYRYENRTAEDLRTPSAFFDLLRPGRIHYAG